MKKLTNIISVKEDVGNVGYDLRGSGKCCLYKPNVPYFGTGHAEGKSVDKGNGVM